MLSLPDNMLPIIAFVYPQPLLAASPPPAQEIPITQEVRPLPGQLDRTPVFNSNSPEKVLKEGILLSTFPGSNKAHPEAHLNYAFSGNFDVFAHHVAQAKPDTDLRSLYIGVILHNPTNKPVTVKVLQGASYLSQPDAPFITSLASQVEDANGSVFAGPGSRATGDILRDRRQNIFPEQIVIPPGGSQMLMNLPVPVRGLVPPLNGRSSYIRLQSNGKVYAASMALFAPSSNGVERAPTIAEWQNLLNKGELSSPRDVAPTVPNSPGGITYGRVAGVSIGSRWQANLADPGKQTLSIPAAGKAISWGISTLVGGQLGTGQVESAKMAVRYPDTAYESHGNYGVHYSLKLPLFNPSANARQVTVALQTPLKQESIAFGASGAIDGVLRFLNPLPRTVHFRGTVKISYPNDQGTMQTKYYHLVQKRGDQGSPLVTLTLPPRSNRSVQVDLLYPPDATPPQVLTLRSL
jgi:Protein of unknown function (DUF3370)